MCNYNVNSNRRKFLQPDHPEKKVKNRAFD